MKPDAFDTSLIPRTPRVRRPRPTAGRDALDPYLDRAGRYPRLTAEQERARLVRLVQLRCLRWEALLSEVSVHAAVLRALEQQLDEPPEDALADAKRRARALRRRESSRARAAFARSNAALAVELEALDVDGQLAEQLASAPPLGRLPDDVAERYQQRIQRASAAYRTARNRFVCCNLRLVLRVAQRYSGRWMSLVDRVQEGNLGLIKAVERFDLDRGTRFSTYAVWWIRHGITRALINRGRTIRIPANLHVIFTKVRRARATLEARLGRPPTREELAAELEVPLGRVVAAIDALELRSVSLDGSAEDREGGIGPEAMGIPAPQVSIDEGFDQRRAEALAREALELLSPRERDILERRFALAGRSRMTLEALGRSYQISRERVRQLQNRALRTLRHAVESSPVTGLAYA